MYEINNIFTQLHCSMDNFNFCDIFIYNKLDSIRPSKGLWSSTYNSEYGSHWYQSRLREYINWIYEIESNIFIDTPALYSRYFLLYLKNNSRIYEINNLKDINKFYRDY